MYPRDLPVLAAPNSLSVAMPIMPQQYAGPGMSLAQFAAIVWAYRKQTLLITSAVVLVAGVTGALWPHTYKGTATLMVNFEVNDPLAGREFPVDLLDSYMSTQVELAQGSEVLLPVIERLKLVENEDYVAGYSGDPAGRANWVETRVRKNLRVEQGKLGSQLIYVTYSAKTPIEAAQVANAVAEVYAEQQYARLTTPASDRAQRYTGQLDDLRAKVTRAQEKVIQFRQQHGADANPTVESRTLAPAMMQALKTQLAAQNSQMAELRATLGTRHPQVLALQAQINSSQQTLSQERRAYSGNAVVELESSQYQLELESAQSVYKRALDNYDQVLFASLGGYTNVDFVSRATPPSRPAQSKKNVLIFLACVAGGGLGILIPLCYELLNRRVRCRDDLERDHGIPVLVELGPLGAVANFSARSAT